jgi:hypothetical protein
LISQLLLGLGFLISQLLLGLGPMTRPQILLSLGTRPNVFIRFRL